MPDDKPENTCDVSVRSEVQLPLPRLARYFVAPVIAVQDAIMVVDVTIHETMGAAMSARVVQYTPADS
ncbi:MAG: hypothetical protein OXG67_05630 [bacterium]|nr:hypothetical protein [bacterium]